MYSYCWWNKLIRQKKNKNKLWEMDFYLILRKHHQNPVFTAFCELERDGLKKRGWFKQCDRYNSMVRQKVLTVWSYPYCEGIVIANISLTNEWFILLMNDLVIDWLLVDLHIKLSIQFCRVLNCSMFVMCIFLIWILCKCLL